ncbi:hemerythrin domain-containing protein [Microvirga lenta]|uniref:hemerythrin domain-containing protein n=1 Tax=Microvirga lenta TaxID=2881337 RepID=UPI001CFF5651|nr:hemerythrin domain-containing protein [Microvirga lenta]MCB5177197.1 hemerythrin domain-containing protein [Microvirga lenta]
MDLWHLITNDHANIAELCGEIPRALPDGGVRSRDRLFSELHDELRRHMEAEEESLYDALEDHDRTEHLIAELEHEHEEIERRLGELARVHDKGSRDWTMRFRDLAALIEEHFHREEHELFPAARELLHDEQVHDIRHEFIEEKSEALRGGYYGWASSGILLGAMAGAAAGALVFAAWRRGSFGAIGAPDLARRLGARVPLLNRFSNLFGQGDGLTRRYGPDVLQDVAERTRTPVHDVSSRLSIPIGTTFAVVAGLERQGLVRSIRQQGPARERVVAITTRGREKAQG